MPYLISSIHFIINQLIFCDFQNGDTALHIAAAMGRRKLTRVLLESGCDRGMKNKQNETAVEIAARKNLQDVVQILQSQHHLRRPPIAEDHKLGTTIHPLLIRSDLRS